eukprot:158827-Rhodomonas_salina.4
MLADGMTKPLPAPTLERHFTRLMGNKVEVNMTWTSPTAGGDLGLTQPGLSQSRPHANPTVKTTTPTLKTRPDSTSYLGSRP